MKTQEYINGFNAGKHKVTITNSGFSNFLSEEKKNQWQAGYVAGKIEKKRLEQRRYKPQQ